MYLNTFTHITKKKEHAFSILLDGFYLIHSANNTKQGGKTNLKEKWDWNLLNSIIREDLIFLKLVNSHLTVI